MKKFAIELDSLKGIQDILSLFRTSGNAIRFQIGMPDKTAKDHPELLASKATIVNGGMQAEKAFYVIKPENYDPEDNVCYAQFAVKAAGFLDIVGALSAYNEELILAVNDGVVTVSSGSHATLQIPVVAEEEIEPALPQEFAKKALVSFAIDSKSFLSLLKRGCSVIEPDGSNYTDRAMFSLEKGKISAHSTNTRSVLKAWSEKVQSVFQLNLIPYLFGRKGSSLEPEKQKALGEKLMAVVGKLDPRSNTEPAEKETAQKELSELASEYEVELNKFEFFLLNSTVQVLKRVVAGAQKVQMVVTDNYLYCNSGSVMATFTLGTHLEKNFYSSLGMLREGEPVARCVVDTQTFMNGINIAMLGMSEKEQKPLHITLSEDSVVMSTDGRTTRTPFVEKEGALSSVDCYLSPCELKRAVSSLDNGNMCILFRGDAKLPIEFYNGSLTDTGASYALVLRLKPAEKKAATESAE